MTPIINPWIFYWAEVVEVLQHVAVYAAFISGPVAAFLAIDRVADSDSKVTKGSVRISFLALLVSLVILIFAPSEKTVLKMVVAQNVTYDRVELATDIVNDVYEDIINLFEKEE